MEKSQRKKEETAAAGIKLKSPVIREYSAGGVVFRKKGKSEEWLLIQPKGTSRWQFPKGLIEKSESSENAAIREVGEEGGVNTRIVQKLGLQRLFYTWDKKRIFKTVTFFLMEFIRQHPEGYQKDEVSEVIFVSLTEALNLLTFKGDKELLEKADSILHSNIQDSLI